MLLRALTAALVLSPGVAFAQTSSVSPPNWSGVYAGVIAGATIDRALTQTSVASPGAYFVTSDPSQIEAAGRGVIKTNHPIGGLRGGFDWQHHRLVVGASIDATLHSFSASRVVTATYRSFPSAGFTITQSPATNWLMTVTPRVGVATTNTMAYVSGGLASADLAYGSTFTDQAYFAFEHTMRSERVTGWTGGAGLEHQLAGKVTVGAEYLWVQLPRLAAIGNVTQTYGATGVTLLDSVRPRMHVVRVALNYRIR